MQALSQAIFRVEECTIMDTPLDVIDSDSEAVKTSETRTCTWCLDDGHLAADCTLLQRMRQSLAAKSEGDIHSCPRPSDYGCSRGSAPYDAPRPHPRCHECDRIGPIARFCPSVRYSKGGIIGHQSSVYTNPTKRFLFGGAHHQSKDTNSGARDMRDPK